MMLGKLGKYNLMDMQIQQSAGPSVQSSWTSKQPEQSNPLPPSEETFHDKWFRILQDTTKEVKMAEAGDAAERARAKKGCPPNRSTVYPPLNTALVSSEAKLAEPDGSPWLVPKKFYGKGIHALHQEIEDFYFYMSPNYYEHQVRLFAVRTIARFVKKRFAYLKVELYGSLRTGLYLPTSDVDIVLIGLTPDNHDFFPVMQAQLIADGIADPCDIQIIPSTRIPILKLTEKETRINIDMCLGIETGIKAAELVKHSIKMYPVIPKLVLVLKQFLLQRELNGVYTGGISSYTLVLMTLSFLQQHPKEVSRTTRANLGLLLIELLEFYTRRFNYKNVAIRVSNGGAYIPKKDVIYLNYDPSRPPCVSTISVVDPLEYGNDVSRGSFRSDVVLAEFYGAFHVLSTTTLDSARSDNRQVPAQPNFLGRIIQVTEAVVEGRKKFEPLFDTLFTRYYNMDRKTDDIHCEEDY